LEKDIIKNSGKVKSFEKEFLSCPFLEKMIQTPDFSSFVSELEKSVYKLPKNISKEKEIILFFQEEIKKLMKQIEEMLPDNLIAFFKIKYDFHNLKIFLKEQFKIIEKDKYSYSGMVAPEILEHTFRTRSFFKIPEILQKTIQRLYEVKFNSLNEYFMFLQKNYYDTCKKLIEVEKNDFLDEYLKIKIDFENLSTYIIKKNYSEKIEKNFFIAGGYIQYEKHLNEEILWKYINFKYPLLKTPLTEENFEKEKDKFLINFLKKTKVIPYGIEVIFSYFLLKEKEINNLQRIALGKFYNLPLEILKDWIIA